MSDWPRSDRLRGQLADCPFVIVDVGARQCEGEPVYQPVLKLGAEVHAIDVDEEALIGLDEFVESPSTLHLHPLVLGDGLSATLYVCESLGRSSVYRPNSALCDEFTAFGVGQRVVEERAVSTVRLDDLAIAGVDYVKLDTQGSELSILQNAAETLAVATVLEVEVEMVQQYEDQPLFSDVDLLLRSMGFMFHTFTGFGSRALRPMVVNDDPLAGVNQWLWADAVYVRDISEWRDLDLHSLLKMAVVLGACYGSVDFSHRALSLYDEVRGTAFAEALI